MFSREIIVDNFAGGGGTSTGIRLAIGRDVDIAINHDPAAIAMHMVNHPNTKHYCESVWDVDPREVTQGRPVALCWLSPDCKHFSKAKGGAPVDKNIRGLAWVAVRWAKLVRPRVIMLENVEEFVTWGPLLKNNKPDPKKKGSTFRAFKKALEKYGYQVEYRLLKACDYGAPTIRKRLFLIARCDGRPIVWPKPTHGDPDSIEVRCGLLKPWRTAAEIINWSLPCPSIFSSKEEIKKQYGFNAVRPLADNTQKRIIRGVDKFTIKSGKPFIVSVNHTTTKGEYDFFRGQSIDEPYNTVTQRHGEGVVYPVLAPFTQTNTTNSVGTDARAPLNTARTGGGCGQMLISTSLMAIGQTGGSDRTRSMNDPVNTQVSKTESCLMAANLIQYHSEQSENVRGQSLDDVLMTVDATNRYGLVAAHLTEYYGNAQDGLSLEEPMHTATARDREGLTVAHIVKFKGQDLGQHPEDPLHTVTTSTGQLGTVYTTIVKAEPGVNLRNWPKVRALLNKYCGYSLADDEVILLWINGIAYFIADIGMRMLESRELFNAQGFPSDYIIDRDINGKAYSKAAQVARCGNAVPPPFAEHLTRANLPELCTGTENTTTGGNVQCQASS